MNNDLNKKIIEDFGLASMDSREQEKMIEKIGNLLFESVVERSVDAMDDGALSEFEQIVDGAGDDYQKVISFLKNRVPGFETIVSEELFRLKRTTSGIFA